MFSNSSRLRLYEKIGRYISNGVSLNYALEQISYYASDEGRKKDNIEAIITQDWLSSLRNGSSFSHSLTGWVPLDEVNLLAAGEVSGKLDSAIDNILFINETKKKIKSAIAGIAYPIALIFTTFFFMYIFGTQVVPAFSDVLPSEKWTGNAVTMLLIADFVENYLLITSCVTGAAIFLIIITLPIWTGVLRRKLDSVPPWSIYRILVGGGFLLSLSSLLEAGVPASNALKIINKNASPWYRERLLPIHQELADGAKNIGDAMYRTKMNFPSKDMVTDLRSYAELDGFEGMLYKLSRQWQDDIVKLIEQQMSLLKNAAIVFMGLVFMWIITGMFDLQQQISSAASGSW